MWVSVDTKNQIFKNIIIISQFFGGLRFRIRKFQLAMGLLGHRQANGEANGNADTDGQADNQQANGKADNDGQADGQADNQTPEHAVAHAVYFSNFKS